MKNHSRISDRILKSGVAVAISGLVLFCAVSVQAADKIEKYDYDLKYSIQVPVKYQSNIVSLSAGRLNIQFSDTVYFALTSVDYYDQLSNEEVGDYNQKDFTLDKDALNDTYNNEEYMTQYFQNKLNTIVGKERIEQTVKETVNGSDFWVCSYVVYTESVDPTTLQAVQTDVGEGKMYFNMTNGISYFITINSSAAPLSATPDALNAMQTFQIGKKTNPAVYVVWTVVAAAILAFLYFLNRQFRFFDVEVEDEDGNTTSLTGIRIWDDEDDWEAAATVALPNISEIRDRCDADYHKAVKEDTYADGQITQVVPLDDEAEKAERQELLHKLDEMMQRFSADKND